MLNLVEQIDDNQQSPTIIPSSQETVLYPAASEPESHVAQVCQPSPPARPLLVHLHDRPLHPVPETATTSGNTVQVRNSNHTPIH